MNTGKFNSTVPYLLDTYLSSVVWNIDYACTVRCGVCILLILFVITLIIVTVKIAKKLSSFYYIGSTANGN